ncbi:MAG: hypothetical protein FJZ97_13035, partial [Chloroflexi bacterium]|nr:hypothetical protein [Chloroflexota bacterium]
MERHTIWRILFPYETLKESINAALGEMFGEAARDVGREATRGISSLATAVLLDESPLTRSISDARRDGWRVGLVIAGILMPLSFMASVVAAMKDSGTSVTGYASAREALLNWVIAAGAAVSSYYILGKGIELSAVGTGTILEGLLKTTVANLDLGAFFEGLVAETRFMSNPGVLQIFLAIFGTLLSLALLVSVGAAFLAREVILLLAVCIAPVMLILGSMGPLRWLHGMWLKVTVIALLLGPANAFLLGGSALLAQNAHQSGLDLSGFTGRILGYLVVVGIVSVLLGLNGVIGKMVYGAAIEVAEKAWNGMMVVGGAALGLAAGGMLGGAGAAATGAAGSTAAGTTASSAGGMGTLMQASSSARVVGAMGQALAATGVPGARGFAAGMNAGGSLAAHQQIKQGIADASQAGSGRRPDMPWDKTAFSNPEALAAAGGGVRGELQAMGDRGTLAEMHMPSDAAMDRVSAAEGVAGRLMEIGQKHGVDTLGGLRQMGLRGRDAQAALIEYNRAVLRNLSFGGGWPYKAVPFGQLPKEMTMRDLYTAGRILRASDPGYVGVPSIEFLDQLAQTVHQRRVQLHEDPHTTIEAAGKASDLQHWMRDSYSFLPE